MPAQLLFYDGVYCRRQTADYEFRAAKRLEFK